MHILIKVHDLLKKSGTSIQNFGKFEESIIMYDHAI